MDPISDMLTSIRNGLIVKHPTVEIPFSNLKYEIAKILKREKLVEKIERKGKKEKKTIQITLKYKDKTSIISNLKRISKPGQRIYQTHKEIKPAKKRYGIKIISTSKGGLITNKEAKKQKLGGEVLCEIW
ncbi:MAG: 30S ribosomal protein S8 [Candidatus Nealsonbacteria bacterium]|nr:30S ribosomal protein S8 [Candidatus Nealsonbacteria bacterium]